MFSLFLVNNGKVFFLQERPGCRAKSFKIIKFKTMRDAFDEKGIPLPDKDRLTKIGKFIRSVSLDELLQLINVLKGDMSLVGPRPLLMQYLERYNTEQARRHEVKPGITGWAQVNGRNAISWEEKFLYDVEYVDKQSFILDIKIIWMTFLNVIQRKGISADGHVTMEEFMGSEKINLE
jgi:lipopolysaccharide/colanic/teichoic acid biosynthesis glycosyltransferase